MVAYDSMDLLQAAHTLSGVEMAMWDLLGRARQEPVWKLLGYKASHPKVPYASRLFGDTPQQTLEAAKLSRAQGFKAAKFGWGPIGRGSAKEDAEHFAAAREGLGADGILLVDVGQIFIEDVARAAERLPALEAAGALWLEEPFEAAAYEAYAVAGQTVAPSKTGRRRGRPQCAHGPSLDRLRGRWFCADRLRSHRRHRPGQGDCRLCQSCAA